MHLLFPQTTRSINQQVTICVTVSSPLPIGYLDQYSWYLVHDASVNRRATVYLGYHRVPADHATVFLDWD